MGVIVTNDHVVQGNREVVVDGTLLPRQLAKVVFSDPGTTSLSLQYHHARMHR
ncbi:MAG: hypothetical protein IPM82_21840 [Saprospiraceae bacterium]|nr:hypothetical protein [Saprospiraceae bacterium]